MDLDAILADLGSALGVRLGDSIADSLAPIAVSPLQAAKLLRIRKETIRTAIDEGQLEAVTRFGQTRILVSKLTEWFEECGRQDAAAKRPKLRAVGGRR